MKLNINYNKKFNKLKNTEKINPLSLKNIFLNSL